MQNVFAKNATSKGKGLKSVPTRTLSIKLKNLSQFLKSNVMQSFDAAVENVHFVYIIVNTLNKFYVIFPQIIAFTSFSCKEQINPLTTECFLIF